MSYEDINEFSRKLRELLPQVASDRARGSKANRVRACIRWRAARSDLLGHGLFYDPPWDILLCLYANHLEGTESGLDGVIRSVGLPRAIISRWLAVLEERGLVCRSRAPRALDGSIRLTDTGLGGMHALCEVLAKEPPS
jgi:DNA-binding transcriptional ArsR family regulator